MEGTRHFGEMLEELKELIPALLAEAEELTRELTATRDALGNDETGILRRDLINQQLQILGLDVSFLLEFLVNMNAGNIGVASMGEIDEVEENFVTIRNTLARLKKDPSFTGRSGDVAADQKKHGHDIS